MEKQPLPSRGETEEFGRHPNDISAEKVRPDVTRAWKNFILFLSSVIILFILAVFLGIRLSRSIFHHFHIVQTLYLLKFATNIDSVYIKLVIAL